MYNLLECACCPDWFGCLDLGFLMTPSDQSHGVKQSSNFIISASIHSIFLTTVFHMDPCLLLSSGVSRTYELVTSVLPQKSH